MSSLVIDNACQTSRNEPVGTTSLAAASCNLSYLDKLTTSTESTATNRVGVIYPTVSARNATLASLEATALQRINAIGVIFDSPIRDWSAGLVVSDLRAHRFPASTGDIYIPTATLPFTTGSTFNTDDWELLQGVTDGDILSNTLIPIAFTNAAAYSAFTSTLPIGKNVYLEDRDATFKVISGTGSATGYGIIASTEVSQSASLVTSNTIETTHFGASPSATAAFNDGAIAEAIATATPLNRAIHSNSGSYSIAQEIIIPSNVEFYGDGKFATFFVQSALNAPSIMISTPSGSEYQNIHDIGVRYALDSVGGTSQTGFKLLGTRRAILQSCSVDNLNQSISDYSGIGILMDMDTVTNAYTSRILDNTVLGSTYGVWSRGPITSCTFAKNHFKTLNGMRFDRDSIQPGSTAIFGNQIYGNLIQAHSSATFGSGNGIDFGQSDSALSFTYASSNQIGWNYIERFLNGILLRDGSKNFHIDSQSWDNATSQIVDLNTAKDGYSGIDAQNFKMSTRTQTFEIQPRGLLVTDKISGNTSFEGSSATVTISANDITINPNRKRLRIWGNGAQRTGAILSTASAIEGERHSLVGFSWGVAFDVSNIVGVSSLVLGNLSGQSSHAEVEYDDSLDMWLVVSNVIRP